MLRNLLGARALLLLLLLILLVACGHTPPASPPVPPPAIPPLPPSARQPAPLDLCSPTCSDGWRKAVEALLQKQTGAASLVPSAPPGTKR